MILNDNKILKQLLILENKLMSAIDDLNTIDSQIAADVQTVLGLLATASTSEDPAIQAAVTKLQAVDAALKAVIPTPVPTPVPVTTTPTA